MKKYLVLIFMILVIGANFIPCIGAGNISKLNAISANDEIISSVSQPSNVGLDLAIIDIVPYIYHNEISNSDELHVSLEIKNVGDTPFGGIINYYGNSSYWINDQYYSRAWGFRMGALDLGETWIPQSGAGVFILNYIPRIFSIEYEITPVDTNPNNNFLRQVYLLKGKGIFPLWIHLPFLEFM